MCDTVASPQEINNSFWFLKKYCNLDLSIFKLCASNSISSKVRSETPQVSNLLFSDSRQKECNEEKEFLNCSKLHYCLFYSKFESKSLDEKEVQNVDYEIPMHNIHCLDTLNIKDKDQISDILTINNNNINNINNNNSNNSNNLENSSEFLIYSRIHPREPHHFRSL